MPDVRKPLWRRFIEFRLLFLLNAVVLVALGFSFGREWVRNREIQQEIARLQEQAQSLEARNLEIADLNTAFRTESFIEREARLKLGMKKPGESVVVVRGGETGTDGTEGTKGTGGTEDEGDPRLLLAQGDAADEVANPEKWWYYFFD